MSIKKLQNVGIALNDVLNRIKTVCNLEKDVDVAKLLGSSPNKLSVWKSRDRIPLIEIIVYCKKTGLSIDYILLGYNSNKTVAQEDKCLLEENERLRKQLERYEKCIDSLPLPQKKERAFSFPNSHYKKLKEAPHEP